MRSIKRDSDVIFGIFLMVVIGLFWGCRSELVGTDTVPVYKAWFTSSTAYLSHLQSGVKEAGFVLFSLTIKTLTNGSFRVYMLAVSFVIVILWYFAFRNNSLLPLTGFSYLITQHFYITSCTNIIRQGIAMAIGALAITFLFKNKKLYFFLLLIAAVLFHYSAIVLLLFLLFSKIRIPLFWSFIILVSILSLVFLSSTGFVSDIYTTIINQLPLPAVIKWRATHYLNSENAAVLSYGFFLSTTVTVFLLMLRGRIEARNEIQSRILINGMFFYILISILFSFNEVLFRVTMYFYVVEFLAIPVILCTLFEIAPKYKVAVLFSFISFLVLSSVKTILSLSGTQFMAPYFN